ncbi:MAG: hypothetical protein RL095_3069, partial [Verrucomicrobiota bacterium]
LFGKPGDGDGAGDNVVDVGNNRGGRRGDTFDGVEAVGV